MFKDITPVLEDAILCGDIVQEFKEKISHLNIDAIAGVESRGFLFGMPLAIAMGVPFITVRKKGKLPYKTVSYKYDLEYGSAEIEVHKESIKPEWNVLVHDDLLATGGTAKAASELIQMEGAKVAGFSFLVELAFLNGQESLKKYSENNIKLITY
ncbi:MAG: adenine phosphoribosyltransferase [Flavobacteriales bacterium]|jgi:adenine phosphoribosyltransferase